MRNKQKVLVIVGPTAVGKTALSVQVAKECHGEIISGDSMQVYRELDIGTAKITEKEAQGIPHHLIDIKDYTDNYSVSDFQQQGRKLIQKISEKGCLPIVVGGTGLYIQALLFDFSLGGEQQASKEKSESRQNLEEYAAVNGNQALWQELEKIDPLAANKIHPNNVRRVIRAIEVMETTGISLVAQGVDFRNNQQALYDVKLIGLTTERELLYQRINSRVDIMLNQGLVEEAKKLLELPHVQSAKGIGYKELFPYLKGEIDLMRAKELIQQNSRRYAKRQVTWFRNRMTVEWWDLVKQSENQLELLNDIKKWQAN